MGLLIDEDQAMVWRGPMVQSALEQMLKQVAWGDADIMIVDLPPGTGDIHLSLTQKTTLAGAVIVSTPQDLSLIDARKGLNMFRKVDVPILGIVKNMSYFCLSCLRPPHRSLRPRRRPQGSLHARHPLPSARFPSISGSARPRTARRPIVAAEPSGAIAEAYLRIASAVLESLPGARARGPQDCHRVASSTA